MGNMSGVTGRVGWKARWGGGHSQQYHADYVLDLDPLSNLWWSHLSEVSFLSIMVIWCCNSYWLNKSTWQDIKPRETQTRKDFDLANLMHWHLAGPLGHPGSYYLALLDVRNMLMIVDNVTLCAGCDSDLYISSGQTSSSWLMWLVTLPVNPTMSLLYELPCGHIIVSICLPCNESRTPILIFLFNHEDSCSVLTKNVALQEMVSSYCNRCVPVLAVTKTAAKLGC